MKHVRFFKRSTDELCSYGQVENHKSACPVVLCIPCCSRNPPKWMPCSPRVYVCRYLFLLFNDSASSKYLKKKTCHIKTSQSHLIYQQVAQRTSNFSILKCMPCCGCTASCVYVCAQYSISVWFVVTFQFIFLLLICSQTL